MKLFPYQFPDMHYSQPNDLRKADTEILIDELFALKLSGGRRKKSIGRLRVELREKVAGLREMKKRKQETTAELKSRGINR
jgi:hypothetical protein